MAHYHVLKIAVKTGDKRQVHPEMSSLFNSLYYFNNIVHITCVT